MSDAIPLYRAGTRGCVNPCGSQTVNHTKPHLRVIARPADGMADADPRRCIPGAGGVPRSRYEIDEDLVDSQSTHDQCGGAGGL